MNGGSVALVELRRMGMYDASHQLAMWADCFKPESSQHTSSSAIVAETDGRFENMSEGVRHRIVGTSKLYEQEASKPPDKVIRRLAQNREAARKSRLRKKAYIQQLELSRIKLAQLEQEVSKVRQQGAYISGQSSNPSNSFSGTCNSGVAAFELEYGHWIEEQNRQIYDLRAALQERFFLWIGGFRPSGLLKQSSQQTEDALSQGLDKLQQTISETVAVNPLGATGMTNYMGQMGQAMENLEALVSVVDQADRLRQEALKQMYRILTTRQAARGLLALGDYLQRLRALSSLWAARPREPV
ncbi:hypothetical protein HPP92_012908 [Vanilla planifolia]|uniref:DOG1 domain-containing protein n=1 Tax=Vanilla planifolia TaxID=51239 RepID=A0A835UUQ8_VANPL|nr:hypothetical protein HPP92_013355 [Vanilla planifolia]KAG0478189.1 hypothetical protein HPP92_012908 [Vanilla planifolia]